MAYGVENRRKWTDLDHEELQQELGDSHMWISALACINPSDDLKRAIGEHVLQALADTELGDSSTGLSPAVVLSFNKS